MQFLAAIYEENNEVYASLGLTVEECRAIIENTLMKLNIVWEIEEAEEDEEPEVVYVVDDEDEEENAKPAKLVKLTNLVDYMLSKNMPRQMKIQIATMLIGTYNKFKDSKEDRKIVISCLGKVMRDLQSEK